MLTKSDYEDLIEFSSPKLNNSASKNPSLLISITSANTNLLDTSLDENNGSNGHKAQSHPPFPQPPASLAKKLIDENSYDLLISPQKFNESTAQQNNSNSTKNSSKDFSDVSSMDQTSSSPPANSNYKVDDKRTNLEVVDFIEVTNDINLDQEDFW